MQFDSIQRNIENIVNICVSIFGIFVSHGHPLAFPQRLAASRRRRWFFLNGASGEVRAISQCQGTHGAPSSLSAIRSTVRERERKEQLEKIRKKQTYCYGQKAKYNNQTPWMMAGPPVSLSAPFNHLSLFWMCIFLFPSFIPAGPCFASRFDKWLLASFLNHLLLLPFSSSLFISRYVYIYIFLDLYLSFLGPYICRYMPTYTYKYIYILYTLRSFGGLCW